MPRRGVAQKPVEENEMLLLPIEKRKCQRQKFQNMNRIITCCQSYEEETKSNHWLKLI